MASKALKEFAASFGFEEKNDRFFGDYQGYSITITEGTARRTLIVGMTLPNQDSRLNHIVGFIQNNKSEYKIIEYSIHPSYVSISLQDAKDINERITTLMNNTISMLKELGVPGSQICWFCQNMISGGAQKLQINEAVIPMHSGCVESFARNIEEAKATFRKEKKNYGRGFVGALLGSFIGVIPWIVLYTFGWFSGLLGLLIGFAAKKGYELMGGKPGKAKAWIVVILVILAVFVGQIAGDYIQLHKALQEELGATGITLSDLNDWYSMLFNEDPEFRGATIKNILMGLLFAFLGMYGIFAELKKEGKGNVATIKRLD